MTYASSTNRSDASAPSLCPFHDGPETLDGLLAAVESSEAPLLDACLVLRSLMSAAADAEACLAQACRIRQLLDGRHHLAFYRVRCWLRRTISVEVRGHRGQAWQRHALPLDFARLDEVIHRFSAPFAHDEIVPAYVHLRFAFAEDSTALV